MEVRDAIHAGLDRIKQATAKAVDGLSHHELMWRPGPEAYSIGFLLFHNARSEDQYMQSRIQGKPQVWEAEKWYRKLGLPVDDTGFGYTAEQCRSFPVPEARDLAAYADAVRSRTVDYLRTMTSEETGRVVHTPRGEFPVGIYLAQMLVHLAQHAGEISYIRGLQRGMNK